MDLSKSPKKLAILFFAFASVSPYFSMILPAIDISCGDGSCMAEGLMYRYGLYVVTLCSYYLSAVFLLKINFEKYWQCFILAIPLLLILNPHGYFGFANVKYIVEVLLPYSLLWG